MINKIDNCKNRKQLIELFNEHQIELSIKPTSYIDYSHRQYQVSCLNKSMVCSSLDEMKKFLKELNYEQA